MGFLINIKRSGTDHKNTFIDRIEIGPWFCRLELVLRAEEDGMPLPKCRVQLFSPGRFCYVLSK